MDSLDFLKEQNISLHVAATGAGSSFITELWSAPGCSAYLSGGSFPYATEETVELLGFTPTSFCSAETAVDLASAAFMKAYHSSSSKKPVGLGITATVASNKAHRGDHRVHMCLMTEDDVFLVSKVLDKGVGLLARQADEDSISDLALRLLLSILRYRDSFSIYPSHNEQLTNETELAKQRLLAHPFFTATGQRLEVPVLESNYHALMPGSFNPPHFGHLGLANTIKKEFHKEVIFEIGTQPPHKEHPSVQSLLKRAKLLKGQNVLFSTGIDLFAQKAQAYPGISLVVGSDTLFRLFDPQWGIPPQELFETFYKTKTSFGVTGRMIGDTFISGQEAIETVLGSQPYYPMFTAIPGRWDISSTELRNG